MITGWLLLCAGVVLGMCLNAFFIGAEYDDRID